MKNIIKPDEELDSEGIATVDGKTEKQTRVSHVLAEGKRTRGKGGERCQQMTIGPY